MIYPVVISKNQNRSLEFKEALKGHQITFVFDRCKPDIEGECVVYQGEESEGFLAGKMRNIGLSYLRRKKDILDNDYILFLDGDRVPRFDIKDLDYKEFDAVLFPCLDDPRMVLSENSIGFPFEVQDVTNFCKTENNPFWSCGVMIRYSWIKQAIQEFKGHLFPKEFEGRWGWEDIAVGDFLAYAGAKIGIAPPWMCLDGELNIDIKDKNKANFYYKEYLRRKRLGLDFSGFLEKYEALK